MRIFAALLLTVVTGFTGLVYEVTWQKYLATLLGSHSEATAAVLAIFLGGLSAGYALFGRATSGLLARAREDRQPLRLLFFYAGVEGGIGLYAFLFPLLFGLVQDLSLLLPHGNAGLSFLFDLLLSTLLLAPPSILMGGTIPILTLALSRSIEDSTRIHAWVYGFNTAGAFMGALVAAFCLIPLLGLDHTSYAMGGLNLLAAGLFVLLDRFQPQFESAPGDATSSEAPAGDGIRVEGYFGLIAVATLSGFAMMTLQTLLNRLGALSFGASLFTFAMVVAVFVLSIAIGSLVVSGLKRISGWIILASQWGLVLWLFLLYHWIPDAPYYAHVIRSLFRSTDAAFYPFQFFSFLGLAAVLIIPIGLSGALLPLLFHHLRQTFGDLGSTAGRLYSWNTLGSLLGALLGGYILLFFFDLHMVFRFALAALIVGAAILTMLLLRTPRLATILLVILPALAALQALPEWDPERLDSGLFRKRKPSVRTYEGAESFFATRRAKIIFHRDGPTTTATVREGAGEGERAGRSLATNGKPDGHLVGDYATMALAALIPAMIADQPERSFVIGYGTGVTAGELGSLDQMKEVHVAEISQAVLDAAPFFELGNQAPLANPKVILHRSDAYRSLLRTQGLYDVIVSEPSNPWVSGVEMLFSREFLEAAKNKLSPGGVYAQWFHLYEINDAAIELVLRTYSSVFDHVSIWFTMHADLIIMGIRNPERALDVEALRERFEREDFRAAFERVGVQSLATVFAHEVIPLDVLGSAGLAGPIQTLRHPRLSYIAAKAFFRGTDGNLPRFLSPETISIAGENSLLQRLSGSGKMPQRIIAAATAENCRFDRTIACANWLARWRHDYPASKRLTEMLMGARKNAEVAPLLTEEYLSRLTSYYGGQKLRLDGERPLAVAKRHSTRYLEHFDLVIPFDRRVLEGVWRACDTPACEATRLRFEKLVGPLDAYSAPPQSP